MGQDTKVRVREEVAYGKLLSHLIYIRPVINQRIYRDDYNEWSELGVEGWSYEDVLPVFKRSEDMADPQPRDLSKITCSYIRGGDYVEVGGGGEM